MAVLMLAVGVMQDSVRTFAGSTVQEPQILAGSAMQEPQIFADSTMQEPQILASGTKSIAKTRQGTGLRKEVREDAGQESGSLAAMQTVFYQVDDLLCRAGRFSLKNIQAEASYNLSESIWADNGSDYYFSLLNTEEKKLYLNLKKQADRYLTGTDQFQMTEVSRNGENVPVYILPLISYEGLSTSQMKKVFYCFMFENPQYYFMRNSVVYSENTSMMTVGLYKLFADGNTRAEYTRRFAEQLQAWDERVNAVETPVEKERLIHRIVCDHVTYYDNMAVDDPDDKQMSQSCISAVLFEKKTVCAGYAQLFALLCGRAGIECVTVTSPGHAWNKVRMGNVWYNVDCTWNDCRGDETFLNVTDEQLLAADTQLREHVLSEEWTGTAPACTEVFDAAAADGADARVNVSAPENLIDTVVLNCTEAGKLAVSFEPLAGCDGYTVQYAANGAMLPADKADIEATSYVIDGLKSGKAYYVRVRPYRWNSKGEKLYGTYSKKVKETVM